MSEKNSCIGSRLSKYSKWVYSLKENDGDVADVSSLDCYFSASPKSNLGTPAFFVV